ncbi:MAG TPA: GNAT family protein [Acidimicrobiales bacterium]|nr:GNAT family protein [Acidimicrobiales bacterium]
MAHPIWPFFDLVVRTPRLDLRLPTDDDLVPLADAAASGIHPPDFMPFAVPWTDASPEELRRSVMQHMWRTRGGVTVDDWTLTFAVFVGGVPVGIQAVSAKQFAKLGLVSTGSWLAMTHQGLGLGREMRAAVLHFAFEGLGAKRAESGAYEDNGASNGVSRSLGYRENGDEIRLRRDESVRQVRYAMAREEWAGRRRDDITIEALEPCLPLLGADRIGANAQEPG